MSDNKVNETQDGSHVQYSRFYLRALNELYVLLVGWLIFFLWTIGYCGYHAYFQNAEQYELQTVFGFPDWVFYGIFLPWICAGLFTCWFSFLIVKDDDDEFHEQYLSEASSAPTKVEGSDD